MRNLKDLRILSLILIVAIGLGFEGLRRLPQGSLSNVDEDLSQASKIFSIYRESTEPMKNKRIEQKKSTQVRNVRAPRGVKFDLTAAVTQYQKDHGLMETDSGAKKRPDKLKEDKKTTKKKVPSKYEYVFDYNKGRWVKRKKLTESQMEEYLAKKEEALLKKQLDEAKKAKEASKQQASGSSSETILISTSNGPAAGQVKKEESKEASNQKTYEEWAQLLLRYPSKTELQKFIQAYREEDVTSEDFYKIAAALFEDPRIEMKEQGLVLVDFFPSVSAFRILVTNLNLGKTSAIYDPARAVFISDYGSFQGLNTIRQVLTIQEDQPMVLAAISMLKLAIDQAKSAKDQSPDPSTLSTKYSSTFAPFATLLSEIAQLGGEVSQSAQGALTHLSNTFDIRTLAANETI